MDEEDVLDLTVKTVEEFVLRLGSTVCLALGEDFLRDLLFQNLGHLCLLQDLVLAQREKTFE